MLTTQPYKGARDFYPEDKRMQDYIFGVWKNIAESYGYEPIDAPLLEPIELFAAKSGQEIVSEQTYQFVDRGGRTVVIRPEMTPSVARMVAAKRQELAYPLRWYSIPNVWRYERPQKGRLREHWQLNIDMFGVATIDSELEMITMSRDLMNAFGASADSYKIRINSRKLVNFIMAEYLGLDIDKGHMMTKLLDKREKMSKSDFMQQVKDISADSLEKMEKLVTAKSMADLPKMILESRAIKEVQVLFTLLHERGIEGAVFDIGLVRGFDYYTDIVFEVFDTDPENSRSLFGGGRYDGLVGLFGVEPVPVVGFAMGDVTIKDFLKTHKLLPDVQTATDVYIAVPGTQLKEAGEVAKTLREMGVNTELDITGRKLEKQIKTASKKGIKYILFVGKKEVEEQMFTLKDIKGGREQKLTLERIAEVTKS